MASKSSSRWADNAEDAELDAKIKREKEEKRLKKAKKAAKLEAEQAAATANASQQRDSDEQPSKRRKLGSNPSDEQTTNTTSADGLTNTTPRLMRLDGGTWGKNRSVEEYDKLNDIEEGTYGLVARATEKRTGTVVALKKLKLDANDRGGLPVTGLREIQLLQRCRHRNVIDIREVVSGDNYSKLDNSIYLVLDFMEHDLRSILDSMPSPFLASEIKRLMLQLTTGIDYLHSNYVLHRDLKTSNILLNNRGLLKIADFGMARYVGDPPPQNLTLLVVTLWYRAPELLLGTKAYGSEIDMWSVGCIFGELVTREPLLQGKNEVDQISKTFELCGIPTDDSWPGFRRLPNARSLRLPRIPPSAASSTTALLRARFPNQTNATTALLSSLLSMDPEGRPTAKQALASEYFSQDPKPKPESMFPTFPSKAGQERRRRAEPHAPARGEEAGELGEIDFSGIFSRRDKEERGAGFSLRMV